MKHNKYVEHQNVKIYFATNQFLELQFLETQNKTHGIHGLGNNYHVCFDTKLGHGTCAIRCIPCSCTLYTSIMDQPWVTGLLYQQQPCYQPSKYCTYWPMLGSFNNKKLYNYHIM